MIKKSFILSVLFIAGLFVFTGGSCEPEQTLGGSSDSTPYTSAKVRSFKVDASLGPVIEKISHGQMEEADQLLAAKGTSRAAGQLKILLNHYEQLQAYRRTQRQQAYEEQMDELEKLKEQLAGRDPNENETDEIMLAVVRAREYAVDARKEEVTSDPFVQKVLRQMQRRADAYEQEGKWLDAYTHNYYWLTALYEDNEAYKDKADELTELATIELSLKDSSCGETAAERYEGIEPEMFLRALKLLENSYVTVVDYGDCPTPQNRAV